jgi:hypothetical protein
MSNYSKTDDLDTRSLTAAFKEVSQRSLGVNIPETNSLNPEKPAHLRSVQEKAALLGRSVLHATLEAAVNAGRSPPNRIAPSDLDRSESTRNLDSFERALAKHQHRSALPPERGLTWSSDAPKMLEEIRALVPGMPNPLLLTAAAAAAYEKHHVHAAHLREKNHSVHEELVVDLDKHTSRDSWEGRGHWVGSGNVFIPGKDSARSMNRTAAHHHHHQTSKPVLQIYSRLSHLNLVSARISHMDAGLLDFESLHELNVSHNEIKEVRNLPSSIKALHACDNEISRIYWGPSMTPFLNLIHLALGCNQISSLNELQLDQFAPRLIVLDVSYNDLTSLENALSAVSRLSQLAHLRLYGNPCALILGYIDQVLLQLPKLHGLDDQATGEEERITRKMRRKLAEGSGPTSNSSSTSLSQVELHPLAQFKNSHGDFQDTEKIRLSIHLDEVNQLIESADVFNHLQLIGLELPLERMTSASYRLSFTLEKAFTAISTKTSTNSGGIPGTDSSVSEKGHVPTTPSVDVKRDVKSVGGKGKDVSSTHAKDAGPSAASLEASESMSHPLPLLTWRHNHEASSVIVLELPPTIALRNALRYDNLTIKLLETRTQKGGEGGGGGGKEEEVCIAEGVLSLVGLLKPPEEPFLELETNLVRLDLKRLPSAAVDAIEYIKSVIEMEDERARERAKRLIEEAAAAQAAAAALANGEEGAGGVGVGLGSRRPSAANINGGGGASRRPSAANVLNTASGGPNLGSRRPSAANLAAGTSTSRRGSTVPQEKDGNDVGVDGSALSAEMVQKLSKLRPFTPERRKTVEADLLKGLSGMILQAGVRVSFV